MLLNGAPARTSTKLRPGDRLAVSLPPPVPTEAEPEPVPFTVVYEDAAMIVIDKPAGVVVHPAPGNQHGTLVNGLLDRFPDLRGAGEDAHRPGIVHRLDRDTSGLLVVGRTTAAINHLQRQMQRRETEKHYLALIIGHLDEDEGEIDRPVGRDPRHRQRMAVVPDGRSALTRFTVLDRYPGFSLLDVQLVTGRTHQIRVHFASIGHPVVGDPVYAPPRSARPRGLARQFLHSARLRLSSPHDNAVHSFSSPLPPDLATPLATLRPA